MVVAGALQLLGVRGRHRLVAARAVGRACHGDGRGLGGGAALEARQPLGAVAVEVTVALADAAGPRGRAAAVVTLAQQRGTVAPRFPAPRAEEAQLRQAVAGGRARDGDAVLVALAAARELLAGSLAAERPRVRARRAGVQRLAGLGPRKHGTPFIHEKRKRFLHSI